MTGWGKDPGSPSSINKGPNSKYTQFFNTKFQNLKKPPNVVDAHLLLYYFNCYFILYFLLYFNMSNQTRDQTGNIVEKLPSPHLHFTQQVGSIPDGDAYQPGQEVLTPPEYISMETSTSVGRIVLVDVQVNLGNPGPTDLDEGNSTNITSQHNRRTGGG